MKKKIIYIYIICSGIGSLKAQQLLSLQQALDRTISSNQMIRSAQLQEKYSLLLSEHTSDIAPALVSVSGGQINSWFPDNAFTLQQNFSSLAWYRSQRELMKADLGRYAARKSMVEKELIREVRQAFAEYIFLKSRLQMMMKADSLFRVFLQTSALQLRLGEINKVQQLTIQSRYGVLLRQVNQLESDLGVSHFKLQWLLNTNDSLSPSVLPFDPRYTYVADTSVLVNHPNIKAASLDVNYASKLTRLEKSMLRPGWGFQYNNMTMLGSGADNKLYNYGTRFQNITVGMSIPVFSAYRHQRIRAMRVNEALAVNEQQRIYTEFKRDYFQAFQSFSKARNIHYYYKDSLSGSTDELQKLMTQQLSRGEISLPDWILAFNQLLDIKTQAIDAEWDTCRWYIQLLYLTNQ